MMKSHRVMLFSLGFLLILAFACLKVAHREAWAKGMVADPSPTTTPTPNPIAAGVDLAQQGKIPDALAVYATVQQSDPSSITANDWNNLCWFGGLWDHAAQVQDACERAVATDPSNGEMHDSRGLVRALLGDNPGAIADFTIFTEWAKTNPQFRLDAAQRQAWIVELTAGRNPISPQVRQALLEADLASILLQQGDTTGAYDKMMQALGLYQTANDRNGEIKSFTTIGNIYYNQNLFDEAIKSFQQALPITIELRDQQSEVVLLYYIAFAYQQQSKNQEAGQQCEAATQVVQQAIEQTKTDDTLNKIDIMKLLGSCYSNLGNAYNGQKLYGDAINAYQKAIQAFQQAADLDTGDSRIGDQRQEGVFLMLIAGMYNQQAKYDHSVNYYQKSLVIWHELGSHSYSDCVRLVPQVFGGEALHGMGDSYKEQDAYAEALAAYQQSLVAFQQAAVIAGKLGDQADNCLYGAGPFNYIDFQATSLLAIGTIYVEQGEYEKAQDALQQAREDAHEASDIQTEAAALSFTGATYTALGQYDKALAVLGQAQQDQKATVAEFNTLNNMGTVYLDQGQYAMALTAYQEALAIVHSATPRSRSFDQAEGRIRDGIGQVYYAQGKYEQALDYLGQALTVTQAMSDSLNEGKTLNNIGNVYSERGQSTKALNTFEAVLKIAQELDNQPLKEASLNNRGGVYENLGQYPAALIDYQQALTISRQIGDKAGESTNLENIGSLYEVWGDYLEALKNDQQALTITQKLGDSAGEASLRNNIGAVYIDLGQFDNALAYLQQALTIRSKIGELAGEAVTRNNMGVSYNYEQNYDSALTQFRQALTITREIHDPVAEVFGLVSIGAVYDSQNRYPEAMDFYQQALTLTRALGARSSEGDVLNNIGVLQEAMGQEAPALKSLQDGLAIKRKIGDKAVEASILGNIGRLYEKHGQPQQALNYYDQAIASREQVRTSARLSAFKTSLAAQSADVYQSAVLLSASLGQFEKAFELAERARARTFLDQIGNAHLAVQTVADPELVAQEQSLHQEVAALESYLLELQAKSNDQEDEGAIQELKIQLADKQKSYEDLLTRLQIPDPAYAGLVSVPTLTLTQTQAFLDPQTTLLAYFVTPDKTLAFVITHDTFRSAVLTVTEQILTRDITEFRGFDNIGGATPPSLIRLYTELITPLKKYLTTPVTGIIPHGVLNYLPFAALTDGQHYMGDDYTIFNLPSASTLSYIHPKPSGQDEPTLILAYGQPKGLAELRYVDQEAAAIASLYQTRPLTETAATRAAFQAGAGQARIVHLAVHGVLDPASPLFSTLVLAPNVDDSGFLDVQQVYGLALTRTDLVVLSACETAVGPRSRGDDIVALNRAFLYAGAPTVVASLWQVDDPATSTLMQAFYTNLKSGMGKAAALRAAQQEIRPRYPNPYYWAAFVLTGDPGALPPASTPAFFLLGLALAILLLGLVVWSVRRRRALKN